MTRPCRKCHEQLVAGKLRCSYCNADLSELFAIVMPDEADAAEAAVVEAALTQIADRHVEGQLVCDFCSEPDINWSAVTAPFDISMSKSTSIDDWGMCDACAELVRQKDRAGLVRRVKNMFRKKYGAMMPQAQRDAVIAEGQDKFWANFMGDINPISEADRERCRQVNLENVGQYYEMIDDLREARGEAQAGEGDPASKDTDENA